MVYDCPAFTFDIDEYRVDNQQMIFVHLRFHKWSASALKHIKQVFAVFRASVDCPLYAFGEDTSDTYSRFVQSFGFKPLPKLITCENGEQRMLFVSHKD